jgi:adenylate cyclase
MRAQPDQALLEAERVMTINPSAIFAYAMACGAANMVGQPDKAIEYADKARRLSPRDPSLFNCLVQKSVALSMLGQDQAALDALDRTLSLSPDNRQLLRLRPAFLAMVGRDDEAREAYQRYASLPGKQIRTIAEYKTFFARTMPSSTPVVVAYQARYLDSLRKAGMPER